MDQSLTSMVEIGAKRCEELRAFGGLNLLHIKRQVAVLLSLIGRDGIFDQYTAHDISHIDAMLALVDDLIPGQTRERMSAADQLMLVLSVYFHDIGMLVTSTEFEQRAKSGFPHFRDEVLFSGPRGVDYRGKVASLSAEKAERFLYQEFVRHTHAERVRNWVLGKAPASLGVTHPVMKEIDTLLKPLPVTFRAHLALVAESHHLDDLDNLKKYPVTQPYGATDMETGNVQYAAIMLRTADLLHMTSDRVPSIAFQVIDPSDPVSQVEWAKQRAVTRVRPMIARDREGNRDEKLVRDTVEVYAHFQEPEGFFALTKFLRYCSDQLRLSHQWAAVANKQEAVPHQFPWRHINEEHVQAEGFIPTQFEFTLDQEKILDLLTGHTLYNDADVVVRELVQNAIDAVRLQRFAGGSDVGGVTVRWNSRTRELVVEDDGTGMTQDIIERHLLKVGSSRYQDPQFIKHNPGFSSISRFGIGVLSAFMIADSVDIVTCHPDESEARHLALRSVHGRYLIRLLDKADPGVAGLAPHGTRVSLTVRESAVRRDVLDTLRKWVVVPACPVRAIIDDKDPVPVGYATTRDALEEYVREAGYDLQTQPGMDAPENTIPGRPAVRIIDSTDDALSLSYAVVWSDYFRDWAFLSPERASPRRVTPGCLGSCVEGVRVEFGTPGFSEPRVIALADFRGRKAPRTNVARSGFEASPERNEMYSKVYRVLIQHVTDEVGQLMAKRGCSLTKAVAESRFMILPLMDGRLSSGRGVTRPFEDALRAAKLILVESGGERGLTSALHLASLEHFWTVDSEFFRSAERLLGELPLHASVGSLLRALGPNQSDARLGDPVLCGYREDGLFDRLATDGREVDELHIDHIHRRIDARWSRETASPRWVRCEPSREGAYYRIGIPGLGPLFAARGGVAIHGQGPECGVRAFGCAFLFSGTEPARVIIDAADALARAGAEERASQAAMGLLGSLVQVGMTNSGDKAREEVARFEQLMKAELQQAFDAARVRLSADECVARVLASGATLFDPSAFSRERREFGYLL